MSELLDRLKKKQGERPPVEPLPDSREDEALKASDPALDINARLRAAQKAREGGVHAMDPIKQDIQTRRELLGKSVGQEGLGDAGLSDLGVRFDLGLSDTFEEKKAKFLDKFPEGEFEMVFDQPRFSEDQRATTVLFRRHQGESFSELDPSMLEASEIWADMADMSGEIPATVLEAIFTRGGRLWTQLWKSSAATVGGDAFKEAIEGVRGYQKETLPELLKRETVRVAAGGIGTTATVAVTGPLNAIRGAPVIAVKPGTAAAQRATKRLGVPDLLPGQVARSPLIQKIQGQAAVVLKTIKDYVDSQKVALARSVSGLREGDLKKVLAGELESVHDAARTQIIRAATLSPNRNLTETGTALSQGIAEYDYLSNFLVNRAFMRAREIEEPIFDITKATSIARDLKRGTVGVGPDGKEINLSRLDPELKSVVDDLLALDPSLPSVQAGDTVITATDQLRALRERLWDLKTPAKGEIRRGPEKQAAKLYAALTDVMRKPKNANPEFVDAWRRADAMASSRFSTMEQLTIIDAAKTEEPAKLAARLAQPNEVDNLRVLHDAMPDSKWREFQEGVMSDFIAPEKVDGLTKRLETFDQSTLDALLSKSDQDLLRNVGRQIDNLNGIGIKKVLEKQETAAGIVQDLIISGDTKGVKALLEMSASRPSLRRVIRAGLMENAWNRMVKVEEGVRTIDRTALNALLKDLRQSGAIHFLEMSDLRTLKSADVLLDFIPTKGDTGASLQAGQVVSGARGAIRGAAGDAIHTIIEHISVGRLLTSDTFRRMTLGTGKKRIEGNMLRVMGSILGREYQKLQQDSTDLGEK